MQLMLSMWSIYIIYSLIWILLTYLCSYYQHIPLGWKSDHLVLWFVLYLFMVFLLDTYNFDVHKFQRIWLHSCLSCYFTAATKHFDANDIKDSMSCWLPADATISAFMPSKLLSVVSYQAMHCNLQSITNCVYIKFSKKFLWTLPQFLERLVV